MPLTPTILLTVAAAVATYLLTRRSKRQRVAYACAGIVLLAGTVLITNGCGGSSSTSTQSKSITINAQYAGDTNYNSSSGQATVAVE
jgi:hypothetical protein